MTIRGYQMIAVVLVALLLAIPDVANSGCVRLCNEGFWKNASEEDVRTMLDRGVSLNARTDKGETPLHLAVINSDVSIVSLLLDLGAKIDAHNENGDTPLHWVMLYGNRGLADVSIVKLLLKRGANPNVQNFISWTPLHSAVFASRKAPSIVELLLEWGANPDVPDSVFGQTSLHFAVNHGPEFAGVINMLLDGDANPNAHDSQGKTPFDIIKENIAFKNTDVYWRLNDAQYQ